MENSHIIFIYEEDLDKKLFDEFISIISTKNISHKTESVEKYGMMAGVEWLLPTAVIAYLSKAYFEGFLNEMGKDHYHLLKKGFFSFFRKNLIGKKAPHPVLLTSEHSPNKIMENNPYSLLFSIMAYAQDGQNFKLLIQKDVTKEEYEKIIDSFLIFLNQYHSKTIDKNILKQIEDCKRGDILVAYDKTNEKIKFLNPYTN